MPKESGTKQQAALQSSPLFKRQNGPMPEKAADGPGGCRDKGPGRFKAEQSAFGTSTPLAPHS